NNSAGDHILIDGNVFDSVCVGGTTGDQDSSNASSIRLHYGGAATNVTISNNDISAGNGRCIVQNSTSNDTINILNNNIHGCSEGFNNKWDDIAYGGSATNHHVTFAYNYIYDCDSFHNWGASIDDYFESVHDNIIDNCGVGILLANNFETTNNTFSHNTVYGATYAYDIRNVSASGNTFQYNIRYSSNSVVNDVNPGYCSFTTTNTDCAAVPGQPGQPLNTYSDYYGNPNFKNPTHTPPSSKVNDFICDFALQAGSGAIGTASGGTNYGADWTRVGVGNSGGTACGDTQAPTAPSNLNATRMSTSQINLSWTASTDNIGVDHYLVERKSGTSPYSEIITLSPTMTTYSDTNNITAGTVYVYRVRAFDAAGNASDYSTSSLATTIVFTDDPIVSLTTNVMAV